ncbi:MAG: aminoglycoside phosphotransferase family protein [bacterium]|nr:aminoglycoside phosphotransferase family protein [bacterium]
MPYCSGYDTTLWVIGMLLRDRMNFCGTTILVTAYFVGYCRLPKFIHGYCQVHSGRGGCVVRFPLDEKQGAALRQESRIARELCSLVHIEIPETRFFPADNGQPAYARHQWIDGEPLTTAMYSHMPTESRHKLADDLAEFLTVLHSIDPMNAGTWYDDEPLAHQSSIDGKLQWFDGRLRARIHEALNPHLEPNLILAVTETVHSLETLVVDREELVLCHGDIHGYNLAMRAAAQGYELGGVFDFETTSILDVHEDFFRLYFSFFGLGGSCDECLRGKA